MLLLPHTLIPISSMPFLPLSTKSLQAIFEWLEHINTLGEVVYGFVVSHLLIDSSEILEDFLTTECTYKGSQEKFHAAHCNLNKTLVQELTHILRLLILPS